MEKLFRGHYAERFLASATGAIRDVRNRSRLFDKISTFIPEECVPGSTEAIATMSTDGRRTVIKAVNYAAHRNALLVRLQGSKVPTKALTTLPTISAQLTDSASFAHPDAIAPKSRALEYARGLLSIWSHIRLR